MEVGPGTRAEPINKDRFLRWKTEPNGISCTDTHVRAIILEPKHTHTHTEPKSVVTSLHGCNGDHSGDVETRKPTSGQDVDSSLP